MTANKNELPMGQELPPPIGQIRTDIERINAIWIGPLPPHGTNLHTADQLREVIAKRDERIRHLERELEQSRAAFEGSENARKDAERAYADGRTAGTASEPPPCRNQGGICACRAGGSFGGCAIERAAAPAPINNGMEEAK